MAGLASELYYPLMAVASFFSITTMSLMVLLYASTPFRVDHTL
jgi:hypothetical protein